MNNITDMEPNVPVVAKRVWNMARVLFSMLRKGIISKRKMMVDLNMMMKRSKIAGKAIHNLMFHHHTGSTSTSNTPSPDPHVSSTDPHEYEFSCSNSPAFPSHISKLKHHILHHSHFFGCVHAPPTDDDAATVNEFMRAFEVLNSEAASPALPGFGRTPLVRQLRITDSPFPLGDVDKDSRVDEAAEEFIGKFYNNLRRQNLTDTPISR